MPPLNIAYKIDSCRLAELLVSDNNLVQMGYQLLGIIIRFQENGHKNDLLLIEQIYFQGNGFKINSANFILLNDESEIFHEVETTGGTSIYNLSLNALGNVNSEPAAQVYTNFYQYNSNTELVFFAIDQIKHIIHYHNYVILSGCELKLGRKLGHNLGSTSTSFSDPYFTLKIEGFDRPRQVDCDNNPITSTSISTLNAQGPEAAIGFACPPAWYTLVALQLAASRLNTSFNYNDQLNDFLNQTEISIEKMLMTVEKLSATEIKISARGSMPSQQPGFVFPQTCTIEGVFDSSPAITFFNPLHNTLRIGNTPIIGYSSLANGNLIFNANQPIPKEGIISGSVRLQTFNSHILKARGTTGKLWWGSNLLGPIGVEIGTYRII